MLRKFISDKDHREKFRKGLWVVAAGLNGGLYASTIAREGSGNVWDNLNISGNGLGIATIALCSVSGFCSAAFYYKSFKSMGYSFPNYKQWLLLFLTPFSALGFLAGGVNGSDGIYTTEQAIFIGIFLYISRIFICADASYKLPGQLNEIYETWIASIEQKKYYEISRLAFTVLFSLGYAIASIDAIFSAAKIVSAWIGFNQTTMLIFSYCSSVLGAVGIFPLALYWIYRGLKQMTNGGKPDDNGYKVDSTDRYTFLALFIVLPNFLGIVGTTLGGTSNVLSFLGAFTEINRLCSSFVYTVTSGTPGMSTFLRATFFRPKDNLRESMGIALKNPIQSSLNEDLLKASMMKTDI